MKKTITMSLRTFSILCLVVTTIALCLTATTAAAQTQTPHNPPPADSLKLFLQPVEVKALRAGEKAPFTKTDITKKQIEQSNLGQDLPFILNQTPSVIVNSDAGNGVGYTGIHIRGTDATRISNSIAGLGVDRSEEHTSELQSHSDLVCRLL